MWRQYKKTFLITLVSVLGVVSLVLSPSVGAASAGDIVINELMYNPGTGNQLDEYLELYNTTSSSIDLEGWCFTAGITLVTAHSNPACFAAGTSIAAGGYLVVSPSISQTQATYNVSAVASYGTSNLSNGGETVTLVDDNAVVIDTLTYDDAAPWPTSPDGTGPSLELREPSLDNSLAASWGASDGSPTPAALNSIYDSLVPEVSDLSVPQDVEPDDQPVVTVEVSDALTVSLIYKILFGAEQTISMNDAGINGDSTAGDGIFSAQLPQQAEGQLVRYKVSAVNDDGITILPGLDDTINYKGYTVAKQINTQLPVFQFFMDPAVMQNMIANHSFDDAEFPCVVAYDNTVIDNALVHIKGQTTRSMPKKAFAVDLPKGHKLQMADMTRSVDEFHLNSTYLDPTGVVDVLGWRLAEQLGMPITQMFKIRMQHNGDFYGLYTFAEEYDGAWREEFDYDSGSFYKGTEKKTRLDIDDGTERSDWTEATAANNYADRFAYALRYQDIPNTLNVMAFQTFIRNWDVTFGKNLIVYFDHGGSERWQMLPYDLDSAMYQPSALVPGQHYVSPYEMPGTGDAFRRSYRAPLLVMYDHPDFRKNYYRRLRTIADDYLASGWYRQQLNDLLAKTETESVLDYQKWGSVSDPAFLRAYIPDMVSEMELNIFKRFQKDWAVPGQQTSNPVVEISNITINGGNRSLDSVTLTNNSQEAVDMSKWSVPELNFTLPIGSVIAPGQSALLARDGSLYTTTNPNHYLIGEFAQDIPNLGSLTLLRRDNSTSDSRSVL